MALANETEQRVSALIAELGDASSYKFFIPGWPPVGADEGLHWFRASLWEAFDVAYQIDHASKVVRFKLWEFGEQEPSWAAISQAPNYS